MPAASQVFSEAQAAAILLDCTIYSAHVIRFVTLGVAFLSCKRLPLFVLLVGGGKAEAFSCAAELAINVLLML